MPDRWFWTQPNQPHLSLPGKAAINRTPAGLSTDNTEEPECNDQTADTAFEFEKILLVRTIS